LPPEIALLFFRRGQPMKRLAFLAPAAFAVAASFATVAHAQW
jgi:hypothetical protein